jgi:RNA polymerase sigma-70 factor (ECF subfamily)
MSIHEGATPQPAAETDADRRQRFVSEAVPLRAELERAARRYTANFHDAEDLVSETYVKAWASFDTFVGGTNMRAWMHRILTNAWIDAYRRSESRPREALTDAFTDAQLVVAVTRRGMAPSPEERKLQGIPSDPVLAAMQELPAAHQAVLFYADICEFSFKQIAEISGIPLGTVMSRAHRARCRMRAALRSSRDASIPRPLSA